MSEADDIAKLVIVTASTALIQSCFLMGNLAARCDRELFDKVLFANSEGVPEGFQHATRKAMAIHMSVMTAINLDYSPGDKERPHNFPSVFNGGTPRQWAEATLGALLDNNTDQHLANCDYMTVASPTMRSDCMWQLARLPQTVAGEK